MNKGRNYIDVSHLNWVAKGGVRHGLLYCHFRCSRETKTRSEDMVTGMLICNLTVLKSVHCPATDFLCDMVGDKNFVHTREER